jgi:hypothetical protein
MESRVVTLRDPLTVFSERCHTIAARVRDRQLPLIEGVDMLYSAADIAGLIESYGDDQIQLLMAAAFMGTHNA